MGKKVVTLGEIMLRLSPPGNTRFVQSDSFDVVYGGGEANVAVSCAMWRANLCATFLGNLVYPTPASKMLHFP